MRKKIISLALALLLCLGLAVPAMAVDTSGLDANGAKAFYDTLSAYGDAVIHERRQIAGAGGGFVSVA